MKKTGFLIRLIVSCAFVLGISCGVYSPHAEASSLASERTSATEFRYGIQSLNLDDFEYYGFEKSKQVNYGSNYYKYGAGLQITWALPPTVKQGDYFTLQLPKEIYVDAAPSKDPVFTIKDQTSEKVILNVYLDKRTEQGDLLKFVATKEAELKADGRNVYAGEAYVGVPVHSRNDDPQKNLLSTYNVADSEKDGDYPKPNTNFDRNKGYYVGFRPNRMYFNDAPISPQNSSSHRKTLEYTSQYLDGTPFTFTDETSVSYKLETYGEVSQYIRFGDLSIQAEQETEDAVIFGIVYNAGGTGIAGGNVTPRFSISNVGFTTNTDKGYTIDVPDLPTLIPYDGRHSLASNMELYEIERDGNPVGAKRKKLDPAVLHEEVNSSAGGFNAFRRVSVDLTFPDDSKTYYIRLKMRKNRTVTTPSGDPGYFIALHQQRTYRSLLIEEFYHPTTGYGSARIYDEPELENKVLTFPLDIEKKNRAGESISQGVKFSLTDKNTGFVDEQEVASDGHIRFFGLLKGHEYELRETQAAEGYRKPDAVYNLHVNDDGLVETTGSPDALLSLTDPGKAQAQFINEKDAPEIERGSFQVFHHYYESHADFESKSKSRDESLEKTEGTSEEHYAASEAQSHPDYKLVDLQVSHDSVVKKGITATEEGAYIPHTDLQVHYSYVKLGSFSEIHEYYNSVEDLNAGTVAQRKENPRTQNRIQEGSDKEQFSSEKSDLEGYALNSVASSEAGVEPYADGSSYMHAFIPGKRITHTYRYVKEEEKPAVGSFKVVHHYYESHKDLNNKQNSRDVELPKTEGTEKDDYDPSKPAEEKGYRLISVEPNNPAIVKTGNSTESGKYIPNTDLEVHYRYVRIGSFTEVHEYYDTPEALAAKTGASATERNPRTHDDQQGSDLENFTSQKHDKEGYELKGAESSLRDIQPNADGANFEHSFVPGENIVHTYRYLKTPDVVVEEKGSFQVFHHYYNSYIDFEASQNSRDEQESKTEGTAEERYPASNAKPTDEYILVKLVTSHNEINKVGDQATEAGMYIPHTELEVHYYYVKIGSFTEVHEYYNSEEELKAHTPAETLENPRTNKAIQSGSDKEEFSSQKFDREGYELKEAESNKQGIEPKQNGELYKHIFIPGERVTHTYRYLKKSDKPITPDPHEPVNPDPNKPVDPEPNKPESPDPHEPVDPKPNKPVNPDPNKPVSPDPNKPLVPGGFEEHNKPKVPGTDGGDNEPPQPVDPQKPYEPKMPHEYYLPKTGEQHSPAAFLFGMGLLSIIFASRALKKS